VSTRRAILFATLVLAAATFAIVQDRVTAAGARRYAAMSRQAIADGTRGATIESVMTPATHDSVRWGAASAGLVLIVGSSVAAMAGRRG
jgi:hypothetical protein